MKNNIYIKELDLVNFQAHSKLNLKFEKGVNIIAGKSGAGKSCVRRSVEFVLLNENDSSFRKQGTKQTEVSVLLSNDFKITRIKSSSVNRYILNSDKEELVFDAVGKSVPEEILKIVGLKTITINKEDVYLNSVPQLSMPFLFDTPGTERAKLFNLLTGNDVLDDLLVSYNKDILSLGKELKKEEINLEELTNKFLKKGNEKEEIEKTYNDVKEVITDIKSQYEIYHKLFELNGLYKSSVISLNIAQKELEDLKLSEDIDTEGFIKKLDEFDKLNLVRSALISNDLEIKAIVDGNKELPSDFPNISELSTNLEAYNALKSVHEELEVNSHLLIKTEKEYNILLKDLEEIEKERSSYQICDKCNGLGVLKNG